VLLLFGRAPGVIGADYSLLTLSVPDAVVLGGDVVLQATSADLALSTPVGATGIGLQAASAVLALSAPVPARTVGASVLQPPAAVLALSSGTAGLTIDLTVKVIVIGGVYRTANIRRRSISIQDQLDEAPNTCTFIAEGFVPVAGQEIKIGVGTINNLEFAGHITSVEQVYEGAPANVAYHCNATDYTRLLDRRFVRWHFGAQSASTIVTTLIEGFTSGFSTGHVAPNLPTISGIDFTWEAPTRALTRIAKLIGAYWYVDYQRDVHFFLTEAVDAPDTITDVHRPVQALVRASDISQVRTRVIVEGGGSSAKADVAPGADLIPVEEGSWYSATGGLLKSGVQRLAYTGVLPGGLGSTVRGVPAPSGAGGTPSATLASGAGGVLGVVSYRVSLKNSAGETAPGPASGGVQANAFPYPQSYPQLAAVAGVGRLAGAYRYRSTNVTAEGETTTGPLENAITAVAVPPPGTFNFYAARAADGVLVGAYSYKHTDVTALGETLPSAAINYTASPIAAPTAPGVAQLANTVGGLTAGATYRWALTNVNVLGETTLGAVGGGPFGSGLAITTGVGQASAPSVSGTGVAGGTLVQGLTYMYAVSFLGPNGETTMRSGNSNAVLINSPTFRQLLVSNLPIGPAGIVGRRIYRNKNVAGPVNWYFVADIPDNTSGSWVDDGAIDGHWRGDQNTYFNGTIPGAAQVQLPSAPAGVLRRRVYRTKANGGTYYLVGEIDAGTLFTDSTPDPALIAASPLINTAGGEAIGVQVPPGPTGTIARRLYRTKAGGVTYALVTELQTNVQQLYVDTLPDDALAGQAPPLVSTAGGQNITVIPYQGAAGTVARRIYRTKAGGATFFLVGQISNNDYPNASFLDSKTDDELGDAEPPTNTAGGSVVSVYNIPLGGAGITSRRIYRTEANGSAYRFLAEIRDNVTTTFLDTLWDKELGEDAPTSSTIGAVIGGTTLLVESVAPFNAGGGWVYIGAQRLRYTGISGVALVGIPASGDGSLAAAVRAGAEVIAAAMITGVSTPGAAAGVLFPILAGDPVNVLVEVLDAAGAAALAALEEGDGIHEYFVQDGRLTIASCQSRAVAELAMFALAEQRVTFRSRDAKLRSGKTITINLGPPTNIVGTFKIQQVVISGFEIPGQLPWRDVTASNYLYSLEHLLRRVELGD
jgi:hypothetical protein